MSATRDDLPPGTTSWVETDLDAIEHNTRAFRQRLAPTCRLAAVVKGNAYGHGVELVAPAALRGGAAWLAVIDAREGAELRGIVGPEPPILVLGFVPPSGFDLCAEHDLQLTVYRDDHVDALAAAAQRAGRRLGLHVKLETGTHRQGLPLHEALALARSIAARPPLRLEGMTTHFADIEDTTSHEFASAQLGRFREAVGLFTRERLRPPTLHSACSAASILFPETHLDVARVGISLYGLWPSRETFVSARERGLEGMDLRPALSWKCVVSQIKDVPRGGYVSYGRTHRVTRDTRLAVLPVGYYEGFDRSLSGRAHVLVRGHRAPVLGRVCMNMTMVDVTDVPEVAPQDEVVLIGRLGDELLEARDLAAWSETIHYETVARIGASVPRLAVRRGAPAP
jgi:alanine racemase